MKKKTIYWKNFVKMLKQGQEIKDYEIDFRNEQVAFKDAALLNRHGISVPEELVHYDDKDIDFSDDTDLTEEEAKKMNNSHTFAEILPLEPEIKEWIKREQIDISTLAARLIRNFYETEKNLPRKKAK